LRIADVIAMTALIIVVLIALIIAANLQTVATGMDLGTEGNATRTTLFTNTWTGLTLASVGIIISAAVGILALVLSTLGRAGGGVA
jgi:ABC-type Fe3+ transport system permease subunit